jgi:hypothetical protein
MALGKRQSLADQMRLMPTLSGALCRPADYADERREAVLGAGDRRDGVGIIQPTGWPM